MGQSNGLLKLSPLRLRITVIALLGLGIFAGSGAVAWAQEGDLAKRVQVFFMQAEFAFLGAGLIRSKSTVNYMTKSFLDFCIAAMSCNGAQAGLVGITALCAFVAPWSAVVIGGVSAPVMILSMRFIERNLKIDDPVGASSVHRTTGLWGLLAVGIFANGTYGDVSGLVDGNAE